MINPEIQAMSHGDDFAREAQNDAGWKVQLKRFGFSRRCLQFVGELAYRFAVKLSTTIGHVDNFLNELNPQRNHLCASVPTFDRDWNAILHNTKSCSRHIESNLRLTSGKATTGGDFFRGGFINWL